MDVIANVFLTILFLLPGFMAKGTYEFVFTRNKGASSEIGETIRALAWNLPGIFGGWALLSLKDQRFLSLGGWEKYLQSLPHAVEYCAFSLGVDWILGYIVSKVFEWVTTRVIRRARKKENLPGFEEGEAWEVFVGPEEAALLKIYPLTNKRAAVVGQLRSAYRPGDQHKGVTLEDTENLQVLLPVLTNPTRTFVDFQSGLVFEIFNTGALKELNQRMGNGEGGSTSPPVSS